jgi:hypothetical protein
VVVCAINVAVAVVVGADRAVAVVVVTYSASGHVLVQRWVIRKPKAFA